MDAPIDLKAWLGRSERAATTIAAAPLAALAATLDRDDPPPASGSAVPPLWHWLYFLPMARQREIGPDGHPQRGGFLPPVALPRRMWAGGRLDVPRAAARRRRGDARLAHRRRHDKGGRSGRWCSSPCATRSRREGRCDREEHDIVYRGLPRRASAAPRRRSAPGATRRGRANSCPTTVLLFRYSALTFNGHRIHYDRRYVTEVEGYPGLIVHGPLIATLLVDLVRREQPDARRRRVRVQGACSPLFDIASVHGLRPRRRRAPLRALGAQP